MIGTPWELASNVREKIEGRLKKRVELFEVPAAAAAAAASSEQREKKSQIPHPEPTYTFGHFFGIFLSLAINKFRKTSKTV